ncbi:PAP2 superfamily protein [Tritrichomonas foetus]|uniref:PAP2 superfamily protein n=1 Tax=Tritrichomonas foetus TaxID=1144522 RepID=A0A1J4KLR9_9EUKA|nr:PAP2 superfamily protein [Tritrichomonas foetus]|eukprot:OHT12163.1 PAP2 superfamily protein [Tritrichomonas foetus]
MKILIDVIITILVVSGAIALQLIPIEPMYFYPETLPLDAPIRNEICKPWLFFVLVIVIPIIAIILYSDYLSKDGSYLNYIYPALYYATAVSLTAIVCSSIHILLGTPRPDSQSMCRTVNVSYWACSLVLDKSELVDQYHSFPSMEAAVSVAAALMINAFFILPQNGFSELVPVIAKSIPLLWALMVGAYCISLSMYRIQDVISGYLIGYIVAKWTYSSFKVETPTRGETILERKDNYANDDF